MVACSGSVNVDISKLILGEIKSSAVGLMDNVSLHQYLQRIRLEVAYAHHPFQEGWRSQSQFVNCLGRPGIKGIVMLKNGHYLVNSSLYSYPRQHPEPKNSQDYNQQYEKRGCLHRLSAYTKPFFTSISVHYHQAEKLKFLSRLL